MQKTTQYWQIQNLCPKTYTNTLNMFPLKKIYNRLFYSGVDKAEN